jgi:hypothetical protein
MLQLIHLDVQDGRNVLSLLFYLLLTAPCIYVHLHESCIELLKIVLHHLIPTTVLYQDDAIVEVYQIILLSVQFDGSLHRPTAVCEVIKMVQCDGQVHVALSEIRLQLYC